VRLNLRGFLCQCIFATVVAAALVTSASAQRGNIRSVTYYTVKPDRIGDFQAEIKEFNAIYAKAGVTTYNSVWVSLTGPRVYARSQYFNKWADLDAGLDPKLKEQAADLARINIRIIDCTENWRRTIEEVQPDLSLPQSNETPKMIRVLVTDIRPDKYQEYLDLVKSDILPAARKGGIKVYEFAKAIYGAPNTEVSSVVAMDNWADLDGEVGVQKGLGKEGYQRLLEKVRPLIVQSVVNEYRFQPELSYLPPATTK
jgi:hypothetical protein